MIYIIQCKTKNIITNLNKFYFPVKSFRFLITNYSQELKVSILYFKTQVINFNKDSKY